MKHVLITGASSGIGLEASKLFLKRGWRVLMCAKSSTNDCIEELLEQFSDNADYFSCDVSKEASVRSLFDYTVQKNYDIESLINNAGIIVHGYLHETSEQDWDNIMETDVKSIFLTAKYFMPHLIKRGGATIVNTASISGISADYKMPVYNAAKGAVVNLTRAMALDYGKYKIRVNSVCPGATDTPMLRRGSLNISDFAKVNPLKRVCEPQEVAKAMYFLSTDESSYCNGVNLPVTGGLDVHTGQPHN